MEKGFDNSLYVKLQTENILKRIDKFSGKLYLEFGGKLFDDLHASRVLPGFDCNAKIKILEKLKSKAEIIFVISAHDIERNKIRADFNITYGMDVMRLVDEIRKLGIYINSVVITQYTGQAAADVFIRKLRARGEKTYIHQFTKGYPTDVNTIVSDEGYGANPYIETTKPLVVVTAPGPGSGKLATCLGQLYHEYKRGIKAGYAKFETFPIWNIPLKHPVNAAYEAATIDLKDANMIDPYHLDAYGEKAVNYNRDIECFPILRAILGKITGDYDIYKSPTDMGVNMAGFAITNDEVCQKAARQEVIRRYYKAACDCKQGNIDASTFQHMQLLFNEYNIDINERPTVEAARIRHDEVQVPVLAIQLENGKIVTGKMKHLMTAASSCVLNVLKSMSRIEDDMYLLSPSVLEPIQSLKRDTFGASGNTLRLTLSEVLIALSICASNNPLAEKALKMLPKLKGLEAHSSNIILPESDVNTLNKLGINLTCEPVFASKDLYG